MKILQVLLKRKLIVGLFVTFIIGIGIYSIGKLEKELMPPITMDGGVVYLEAPSLSPLEVEERLTKVAEQKLATVEGIDSFSSSSSEGYSQLTYTTDEAKGTDVSEDIERSLQPLVNEVPAITSLSVQQFSTESPYEFYRFPTEDSLFHRDKGF